MYTIPPKKMIGINILEILKKYSDMDHRLTQADIMEKLKKEYYMDIDRKTVKRNLMNLLDLNCGIEYTEIPKSDKNGEESFICTDWYITREFDDSELSLLIDSLLFSKQIPYCQCKKLIEKLKGLSNIYFGKKVKHICNLPENQPQNKELFYTIDVLNEAISQRKKVAFVYNSYGADKKLRPKREEKYIVNPYQMVATNGRYYLICNYDKYDNLSNYRIDRITKIELPDSAAKPIKKVREGEIDLPKHMAEHIYMFAGESVHAKFKVKSCIIDQVIDRYGFDADIHTINDEESMVSVSVNKEAFFCRAMQYGPHIEVIEPADIRSRIKDSVEQIADIYVNREKYDKLGVNLPAGVLIYGVPGVGKSLMASALIDAIGTKCFIYRKDKPNGDFVKYIKEVFDTAAKEPSSIVFLDDMDKFANGDERHPDSEEYVTVQACIDEAKNKNVLVPATANNLRCLPKSLLRAGRFDRTIEVNTPSEKDAELIIKHYLSGKIVSDDPDCRSVAKIIHNSSCAEPEAIINEAGIYAGFDGEKCIKMPHFLKAAMQLMYDVPVSAFDENALDGISEYNLINVAYHEAGHVLAHEVLDPGSVALVSIFGSNYNTLGGRTVYSRSTGTAFFNKREINIIGTLAGIAAVEQKLGIRDTGCSADLEDAFDNVRDLIVNNCTSGFHLHGEYGDYSDELTAKQEQTVATEIEKYYLRAKEIIAQNNSFLENTANRLPEKKLFCARDIENIRRESAAK